MLDREFKKNRPEADSPEYKAWRNKVFQMDGFKCVLTGSTEDLVAHHIRPWAKYPNLRYSVSNGVTLSRRIHDRINGNEEDYYERFDEVVTKRMNAYRSKVGQSRGKGGRKRKRRKYIFQDERNWRCRY